MRNQKSKDTYLYSDSRLANASCGYPFKFYEHGSGWPKAQKLAKKRAYEYGIQDARVAESNRRFKKQVSKNSRICDGCGRVFYWRGTMRCPGCTAPLCAPEVTTLEDNYRNT